MLPGPVRSRDCAAGFAAVRLFCCALRKGCSIQRYVIPQHTTTRTPAQPQIAQYPKGLQDFKGQSVFAMCKTKRSTNPCSKYTL